MGGGRPRLWLQGARRHPWQFSDDLDHFYKRIRRLARRIGPYDYRNASRAAQAIDEMTALEVVDEHMPGGAGSVAGRWFQCFLAGFLGLDLTELGGLAVVDNVAYPIEGADERYHVRGGNDQIVDFLAASMPRGSITMDAPLAALSRRRHGDSTFASTASDDSFGRTSSCSACRSPRSAGSTSTAPACRRASGAASTSL
jgi:monoamine oxidase